jgi:hypothetical protein
MNRFANNICGEQDNNQGVHHDKADEKRWRDKAKR